MFKFALVGCGRISKRHSDLLANGCINNATLIAVCDVVASKSQELGIKFNIPHYTDMHTMMKSEDIDVVVVLTESGNHSDDVIALAEYGKHIVVEKPMALELSTADKMISACDKNNVTLFVVKQNRFNLPVLKLREAIEEGRFGKLVMGTVRVRWCRPQEYYDQDSWRGTWSMDGGVLTNQASHHIDLLEWMMGEVDSVFAMSTTRLVDIEAEDTAVATLKFKNGALGVIEATTATRPKDLEGSISIIGEKGSVEIGGFAVNQMKAWNFTDVKESDKQVLSEYSTNSPNVYGFGHQEYYDHVVKALESKTRPLVDGHGGRKSLALISAIYESIETGKEIHLPHTPSKCRLGR